MSALTSTNPTILDLRARLDPNDKIGAIVELQALKNEMLDDATFLEANGLTSHVTTVRTGIPTPTWRKLYGYVQPSKSTTAKITDTIGMMEQYAEVDKALADLNGNAAAWQLSEHAAFHQGMNKELADTSFYGNEGTEPEAFTGLAPRFNSLAAENARNIIVGGSSDTDNTSIWLCVWSPETLHYIYPKGSKIGWTMEEKGQVTLTDNSGGRMEGYRTHYRWDAGLTLRDWRYVVRIPNIEVSALTKGATAGADLIDLMTQALEAVEDLNSGRAAFYCNRTVRSFLRRQMVAAVKASTLMMDEVAGKRVMVLDSVPIRRSDAILNNETLVA